MLHAAHISASLLALNASIDLAAASLFPAARRNRMPLTDERPCVCVAVNEVSAVFADERPGVCAPGFGGLVVAVPFTLDPFRLDILAFAI